MANGGRVVGLLVAVIICLLVLIFAIHISGIVRAGAGHITNVLSMVIDYTKVCMCLSGSSLLTSGVTGESATYDNISSLYNEIFYTINTSCKDLLLSGKIYWSVGIRSSSVPLVSAGCPLKYDEILLKEPVEVTVYPGGGKDTVSTLRDCRILVYPMNVTIDEHFEIKVGDVEPRILLVCKTPEGNIFLSSALYGGTILYNVVYLARAIS